MSKKVKITIIAVIVIAGLSFWLVNHFTSSDVNSFEECVDAGYLIMESYPRRCKTPEGKTFIEDVTPKNPEQSYQEKAERWIRENAPTFIYDGQDLEFVESRGLDLVGCEDCYEYEFEFTSRHGGYGDREGKEVTQALTPHVTVVTMENGEVVKVVTDGKFDEMKGKLLMEVQENWKTYQAEAFAFQYPELDYEYVSAQEWPPEVQIINDLDQYPSEVSIESGKFKCEEAARKTINGRAYCVKEKKEGAAGSTYINYTYSVIVEKSLVTLSFVLQFPNCGNFPEERTECQQEKDNFNIDRIVDRMVENISLVTDSYKEKAITDYLLTRKQFGESHEGKKFCVVKNLNSGSFPCYAWVRCGEFVMEEELKEVSGVSIPVKINYPDLPYYDLGEFSHEAPRDGSHYWEDIEEIFPEDVVEKISEFQGKGVLSEEIRMRAAVWFN